ncbi:MAG TPA: hypothetical protein VF551_07485, partial [Chthoniobacterales bacterium]
ISGAGDDSFRLTNLEFKGTYTHCIRISGTSSGPGEGPYGLIDNCSMPSGGSFIFIRDNPGANPNSWHRPMSFGTKKAIYIEDCTFIAPAGFAGGIADGDNGARYVLRHCNMVNMGTGSHGADSQPAENGQNPNKSILQIEMMHNSLTVDGRGMDMGIFIRGGTANIFDNEFKAVNGGYMNCAIKLAYYRALAGNGVVAVDRVHPVDYLGTQQPGCGYVGKPGQDPRFPNEPWGSVPIYAWSNRHPAANGYLYGDPSGFMQEKRDYFLSYDESGKRPGYTEYTYPHPLRGIASKVPAPKNLRIVSPQ